MPEISEVKALEIIDSRGRPTIKACLVFTNGITGCASVPSGASRGSAEARELRDNDPKRFGGFGCLHAIQNINSTIAKNLNGLNFENQEAFDHFLIRLDGTENKSRYGGNAILALSLAFARSMAVFYKQQLFDYFRDLLGESESSLPQLTINLFSGGKHGGGQIPIQDLLIVPLSFDSINAALSGAYEIYHKALNLCRERYNYRWLTADEGGLAPNFPNLRSMLECAVESIENAGFRPGEDVALALDVAATHFHSGSGYAMMNEKYSGSDLINIYRNWIDNFPIISLEDGLAEEDWESWRRLCGALGDRCLILGDDLLCTNITRIQRAIDCNAANALLLKVNQVGTLTEAAAAMRLARKSGWHITISARSGETEDNWLADLAVGWRGDHIKVGSITQSERLSKYNRLLEIESWISQNA